MKVLILGCGYTGLRLAQGLLAQQIPVQVTNRTGEAIVSDRPTGKAWATPTAIANLPVPVFAFAYTSKTDNIPLPTSALIGVTHVLSTIAPTKEGVDPVLALALQQLEAANLTWFGYLSTTGVYGDTKGTWVDETSPIQPGNERSQVRAQIESQWLASTLPIHIFRLPGIYGPGRSIFDRIRLGTAHNIHKPGQMFSRIHVDDIVQTLERSMQHPNPPVIYNVADDEPTESSTLLLSATQLMGISPPDPIPYDPSRMSSMAASFWRESRRVANHKIKEELGVQLRYPTYREGLKAIWAAESGE
jgi:nucleoside-diphosphate-sugar epimerase